MFSNETHPYIRNRFLRNRLRIILTVALVAILAVAGIVVGNSAQATTTGIFADDLKPGVASDSDRVGVELGIRFTPEKSGSVTDLQYYQGRNAVGVTSATLWSSRGTVLAEVSFPESRTPGWRTIALDSPVQLTAGRTYVASYFAPKGGYPSISRDLTTTESTNGFTLRRNAGVYNYGRSTEFPRSTYQGSNYLVDVVFAPSRSVDAPKPPATAPSKPTTAPKPPVTSTPTTAPKPPVTSTPTAAPKPPVTSTPTPTTAPKPPTTPTTPVSGGTVVLDRSFPNAATTGVPAGTALSPYTGPCTIQTPNVVIDAKQINCQLRILAQNVKITNSEINGSIWTHPTDGSGSFTVSDSNINVGADSEGTGIGDANFTAQRVEVTGGNRSINCFSNCTVEGSYVHSQYRDPSGDAHESGIRMGSNSVIRGNTISCAEADGSASAGCSAALTGYGDFATVEKNTIDGNLFVGGSGGYCVYGGSSTGKPYSSGVNNIKFTNNVWQRGESGVCGYYGAIVSFDDNAPGNVWSNNVFDDGKPVG
ncbi:DUF4082 domain-containing protein [Microbacterium murale]|uniref:DUF4082 domain-containing protein n=1 Tax=Microbacterium murale TaxID=1081040 RepID=A0ABQ1RMS1_9MICO|nr:DUF4082 domain-containing protein [Microbacterium murale]GGD75601.1 hypothetical protein GCM10007269_18350 [Microbacterium murale]